MYTGIFKCRNQRWCSLFHASKHFMRPNCQDLPLRCTTVARDHFSHVSFIKRQLLHSISSRSTAFGNIDSGLHIRSNMCWMNIQFRTCSSGANGRNTSEDKHGPVKDGASFDNEKTQREQVNENAKHCDAHAQLGEQDQKEWLHNEKLAMESKRKESPFFTRREKFKNEFLRRIVPWEKLRVSWDNFPYYINEHTKNEFEKVCSLKYQLSDRRYYTAYRPVQIGGVVWSDLGMHFLRDASLISTLRSGIGDNTVTWKAAPVV